MAGNTQISLPTSIGPIELDIDQVHSFSPDEGGGVVIALKEMIGETRLEIISGFPHHEFSAWYHANKE